jgi:branched-subunit amino acid aminotransferase/4-amino-4-deoxychorismate lyase
MGASNFLLIDGERIVTKALDRSFLYGVPVTRSSRSPASRATRSTSAT